MTLYRRELAGEIVKINALPPAWPENIERFRKWLWHVIENENGIAGLDVETTAIDDVLGPFEPDAKLRTIQFGSARYAWVLDPGELLWRAEIEAALGVHDLRFVTHTNYDVLWCHREFGAPIDERWIDTLVIAALLYPGHDRRDLKTLTTRHIDPSLVAAEAELHERFYELAPRLPIANEQLRKPPRNSKTLLNWGFTNIPKDDKLFTIYGGLDAICVRRLLDVLAAMVKRTSASKAPLAPLSRREQRIARITTAMRVRGMRVDGQWAQELLADVERDYTAADERLSELFGFSPRSPRVGEWLEDRGAEFAERTPTGRPKLTMPSAASDGTLPSLAERYESDDELGPVFADLLTLGSHKNMLANLRIIIASSANDGFVHPQVNTQQAHTGRMSFTKPAVQTYKKRDPRLRGCYVARDGWVLVGADYDSQEVRIGAAYSRDETLLKVVRGGLNQHLVTAKMIFHVEDKTTVMNTITGKTFYDAAKTLDFGQQYGLGPARLGDQLGYPSKIVVDDNGNKRRRAHRKAYRMWEAWRATYAGLVAWSEQLAEKKVIINPWGRRIPADPWRRYANANYAIQSTGRDVLGDAIVRLEDEGWAHRIWCLLHDEIILEVPEAEVDAALAVLNKCMPHRIKDIELPVTAKVIGTRWGADND